ncbi:transmembrane emp24 domain-containing protein 1a [Astyanax mexicanus]|uniref:Transmembrane emp24 domain-containing protein 1-like n=2 Tax=Astyanax mexicanus TaxID=7994 RepID=A0A8T2M781_ASTMX|nr:transmembrane emp24 domain-containing protein 1a [Astyanax mexicanus]KAG9279044.1 transmembrane emp24 domain-containing protein 1-like [Astyanax mexicanus]
MELSLRQFSTLCWLFFMMLSQESAFALGKSQDLTFLLPVGSTQCFFQTTVENSSMAVEYQVLAGSGLDVGFTLISPHGHRLVSVFRKSEGLHLVDPTAEGDYRICFDNSFSRLAEKIVFMEVVLGSQEVDDKTWTNLKEPEIMLGYNLDYIKEVIKAVDRNLERSAQTQAFLRAFEARDRYLLEDNLWRVSFWSSINLLLMLTVALAQVYTVRRFFQSS